MANENVNAEIKKFVDEHGLQTAMGLLIDFSKSVAAQMKTDIIDGAPEAYDTLKEVSDYIATHKDEYDALVALVGDKAKESDLTAAIARIAANEATISTLKADETTDGSVKKIAKGYADGAQTAAESYADTKVGELADGAVAANTTAISTLNGDETTAGSVKKIAKDYADAVDVKVTTNTTAIGTLNGEESAEGSVKNIAKGYADTAQAAAEGKVTDLANGAVATNTAAIATLEGKVAALESTEIATISDEEILAMFNEESTKGAE